MMDEGYKFEINTDDFGARGLAVVDEDPSVQNLQVADDTSDSETDSERGSKKKIVIGLVVLVAMVALAIALSVGLGTSPSRTLGTSPSRRARAANSAMMYEACQAEKEEFFKSISVETTPTPTLFPTSYPTLFLGGEESAGDNSGLANLEGATLNTRRDETDVEKAQRMEGIIPDGFKIPEYDPVCDAKCFTDDVYNPLVATPMDLYNDYVHLIMKGFENPTAVSDRNKDITNDRYGGMMIRMCFHDNTPVLEDGVVKFQPPPKHVQDNIVINPDGKKTWSGFTRYMETSGADASVLICPEERYHPNNNYDDTASRVLEAFQKKSLPDGTSLKEKYDLSYSDLLNNGCIAAVIWAATNADESLDPEELLNENQFVYGRRDACHTVTSPENTTTRLPLCGVSGILPGVQQDIGTIDNWYVDRGFNAYLWLIQFFTHTMMDNMADNCPLQNLVCNAAEDVADAVKYIDDDEVDDEVGNDLDYFEFFIARGTHTPFELGEIIDEEGPNCVWTVDGEEKPWPMTQADCTISLDQAIDNEKLDMEIAITYFHTVSTTLEKIHALLCSLRMMASDGLYPGGACDYVMDGGIIETGDSHYFGAYFVQERED